MKDSTKQQLLLAYQKRYWVVIAGGLLWLALMTLVYVQSSVPVGTITRDPAVIAQHPPYYGALSNLSILLWSASAAVCFLSAAALKAIQARPNLPAFFIAFASLSTALCLDDTYLLHEDILRNHLPFISIPEEVTISIYIAVLLVAISRFWPVLKKTQLWLFGLSLVLFVVAASSDYVLTEALAPPDVSFLVEDGSKLLAIFLWLSYFFRTGIDLIVATVASQSLLDAQPTTANRSVGVMKNAMSRK